MKKHDNKTAAKALKALADNTLSFAANRRCIFIYHQPKQPEALKRFRKF